MNSISGIHGAPLASLRNDTAQKDSAAVAPGDTVSLSAGRPAESETIPGKPQPVRLPARASTRELYFGSRRGMRTTFTDETPSKNFPKGRWKLDFVNWTGAGTNYLDKAAKPGTIMQDDREGAEPLGRIIRTSDGWTCESIKESNLPYTRITRSKLITYLGDDGSTEMTLIELFREGGGAVYRLNADAYRQNPGCTPQVLRTCVFDGDIASAGISFHCSGSKKELSSLDCFAGSHATQATFTKMTSSGESPQGGWKVHLKRPWRVENDLILRNDSKAGSEVDRGPHEKALFDGWKRTDGGWQNIDSAKPTPENFDQVNEARLRTLLTDDGAVFMTLYEEYMDGSKCCFIIDSAEYMKNPGRIPPVLASQYYSAEHPLDEKALLLEAARKKVPAAENSGTGGTVEEEKGWITIDGVKIAVRDGA
jgi:hypothetical protein